ncbi:MAG: hypothetical protein R3B72_50820 [Polyangiaceae bacterium]
MSIFVRPRTGSGGAVEIVIVVTLLASAVASALAVLGPRRPATDVGQDQDDDADAHEGDQEDTEAP